MGEEADKQTKLTRPTVKICGVSTPAAGITAVEAGASFIGFVFVDASPRNVRPPAATALAGAIRNSAEISPQFVGLFVDADDQTIQQALPSLDFIQCHGSETPQRVGEIKRQFNRPVIKAMSIGSAQDVEAAEAFAEEADGLLFDASPPEGAVTTGGNGETFDWSLLHGYSGDTPFLLAGGLTPLNVTEAVSALVSMQTFAGVDVSSGVEVRRGVKDLGKIREFTANALAAMGATA